MQNQHRNGDEIISAKSAIKRIHTSLSAVKISATFEIVRNSKVQLTATSVSCQQQLQGDGNLKVATLSPCCYPVCRGHGLNHYNCMICWSGAQSYDSVLFKHKIGTHYFVGAATYIRKCSYTFVYKHPPPNNGHQFSMQFFQVRQTNVICIYT